MKVVGTIQRHEKFESKFVPSRNVDVWLPLNYPENAQLYFDYGNMGLDALYEPYQKQMDDFLRNAGYEENENWMTCKFDGAEHNEAAWRARVEIPLSFLLSQAN